MAAAAALVVVGALATGCGDKEQPGARNAADSGPGTAGTPTSPLPTAAPTPHKAKKKAHAKRHHRRHPVAAHHRRHHAKPAHPTTAPHHAAKPKPKPRPSAPSVGTAVEASVVKLVNKERAKRGCTALRVDRRLRAAAYLHSRDMGLRHYFDHDSKDGRTPWDRIKAQGYLWPSAENIAAGQPTSASVMDAWMHSAGHRANILNCSYKAIGVGVYKSGGTAIWTQDFGFK
jgi:uncharacterized protein YkwD